jgi:hypothetical protein
VDEIKRKDGNLVPVSPCLSSPLDLGRFFSFLILYTVRKTPWTQGRYLHIEQHKHRINANRHPCLECDSKPQSQCSSATTVIMKSNAMYISRSPPTFRKDVLPPSGLKSKTKKAGSGSFPTSVDFWRNIRRHILEDSTLQYCFGYEFGSWWWRTKPVEQNKTLQILWCWTLPIVLSLSKKKTNTVLFIFPNTTFRRLNFISVFRTGPGPVIGTSSIDWAQLSRFYLKMETESSPRNVAFWEINMAVVLDKGRTTDNVQLMYHGRKLLDIIK